MRKERFCYGMILFLMIGFSLPGRAQQGDYFSNEITEGNFRITFLTPDIFRIQAIAWGDFAEMEIPDSLKQECTFRVLQVEDRLRVSGYCFTLDYIPQPGITAASNPVLTRCYDTLAIYPLANATETGKPVTRGVWIVENRHGEYFPVAENIVHDRLVVLTPNSYDAADRNLEQLSGRSLPDVKQSNTPQIYFRPEKGKAIVFIEAKKSSTIYYTIDGTEPSYQSSVWSASDTLSRSAMVKAFSMYKNYLPSGVATAKIVMSKARAIQWKVPYSSPYCGMGEFALMDGITGDPDDYTRGWIGVPEQDVDVKIELNKATLLSMAGVRFFHQPEKGIYLPDRVTIDISENGRRYQTVYEQEIILPDAPYSHWTYAVTAHFDSRKVKAIRVRASQRQGVKKEREFLAHKQWIFLDEVTREEGHNTSSVKGR
ncbi:MAG: FN3 associated domain-containing protein [Bacteroidales bacterium]|nr:FN3 associated domain-containing protein [Bacteroidales bacterium]